MSIRSRLARLERGTRRQTARHDDWSGSIWPQIWRSLILAGYGGPGDEPDRPPPRGRKDVLAAIGSVYESAP